MGDDVLARHLLGWDEVVDGNEPSWSPGEILTREDVLSFLQHFEAVLCIYSPETAGLYSQYRFEFPDEPETGGISLSSDAGSAFSSLPPDAVVDTGIKILPGECVGGRGIYIKVPSPNALGASRTLPFAIGLKRVLRLYGKGKKLFAPVLNLQDVKLYESRLASVSVYSIDLESLGHYEESELNRLVETVQQKLHSLFMDMG